jgi:hypothetical protein
MVWPPSPSSPPSEISGRLVRVLSPDYLVECVSLDQMLSSSTDGVAIFNIFPLSDLETVYGA